MRRGASEASGSASRGRLVGGRGRLAFFALTLGLLGAAGGNAHGAHDLRRQPGPDMQREWKSDPHRHGRRAPNAFPSIKTFTLHSFGGSDMDDGILASKRND